MSELYFWKIVKNYEIGKIGKSLKLGKVQILEDVLFEELVIIAKYIYMQKSNIR